MSYLMYKFPGFLSSCLPNFFDNSIRRIIKVHFKPATKVCEAETIQLG